MNIEDLEFGRLYEIVYVPKESYWTNDNLVGHIIERAETVYDDIRISELHSYDTFGHIRRNMYIHGAEYRPLNLKDAAKIRKGLS